MKSQKGMLHTVSNKYCMHATNQSLVLQDLMTGLVTKIYLHHKLTAKVFVVHLFTNNQHEWRPKLSFHVCNEEINQHLGMLRISYKHYFV